MKNIILIISLLFSSQIIVIAQENTFEEKVMRLLKATGAKQNFDAVIENMITLQKDAYKGILDNQFFEELNNEMVSFGYEKLAPKIIPIYKKHLTEKEIDEIIKFYESEVGKSLVNKMPMILTEAMNVGAEWGEELAIEIGNRIDESNVVKFNQSIDSNCNLFKIGDFYTFLPDSSIVNIERTETLQIEKYNDQEYKYKIEWVSDCKYILSELNTDQNSIDNDPLEINIYEVKEKSCRYISKLSGKEIYSDGEIILKQ